jgi:hypothetical protein
MSSGENIAKNLQHEGETCTDMKMLVIDRTSQLPAPGVYGVWNPQMNGGKFNLANPKTPLDWQILQAQKLPGPGQYHSMTDASSSMSGGKFNTSKSKSEVEWIIHRSIAMQN